LNGWVASEFLPQFTAPGRPSGVIRRGKGFHGSPGENKVDDSGCADGSPVGTGIGVDLLADAERGFSDLVVRPHVPDDGGIGLAARQHDGEITDDGLSRPLSQHEGGKDDEGVPGSDKEIPVLQVLYGRRFPIPLFPEGTHGVGRERA
jgi:hypothetical protein